MKKLSVLLVLVLLLSGCGAPERPSSSSSEAPPSTSADVSSTYGTAEQFYSDDDESIPYNAYNDEIGFLVADAFDAYEFEDETPPDGEKYLFISIVVSAFTDLKEPLYIGDWTLQWNDSTYINLLATDGEAEVLLSEGESVGGILCFTVPENCTDPVLKYKDLEVPLAVIETAEDGSSDSSPQG